MMYLMLHAPVGLLSNFALLVGGGEGRDETPLLTRHHFGLITYPGLKEREGNVKHYVRLTWASNPRPWDYESHALPTELSKLEC